MLLFLLITDFWPSDIPPVYAPYYLAPVIGISALLWGVVWWLGMKVYMRWKGLKLVVTRTPWIEQQEEDGEWTLRYEIIKHRWVANVGSHDSDDEADDFVG
jgi:hypothetical protein